MSVGATRSEAGGRESASRRRRLRRLSIGHLAVAITAILALVANLAFLRSVDDSVEVVVAAGPITAGETVAPAHLTTAPVRADASVLAGLITSMDGLEGRIARRDLVEGELVARSDLLSEPAPDGLRSMAVPIDPAHAAGGAIRVGDRVDIVDVDREGVATFVVRHVPVLAVSDDPSGALSVSAGRHIVLGLAESEVLAVATAIADGEVDVVVSTGAGDG